MQVKSIEEALALDLESLKFPIVVKGVLEEGGKGIYFVKSVAEFEAVVKAAFKIFEELEII